MLAANNYQTGDQNRSEIDPDLLVKGVEDIIMDAEARERLYDFIARCVRKVCPDSMITKSLRAMPGYRSGVAHFSMLQALETRLFSYSLFVF